MTDAARASFLVDGSNEPRLRLSPIRSSLGNFNARSLELGPSAKAGTLDAHSVLQGTLWIRAVGPDAGTRRLSGVLLYSGRSCFDCEARVSFARYRTTGN